MMSSGLILNICVFAMVAEEPEEQISLLSLTKDQLKDKLDIIRQSITLGSTEGTSTTDYTALLNHWQSQRDINM